MIRLPLLLLLAVAGCVGIPTLEPPAPPPPSSASDLAGIEAEVADRANRYRAALSLPPLIREPVLSDLAREHSERMAAGRYGFGHDGFDNRFARARAILGLSRMSENVAMNNHPSNSVALSAVTSWIDSPGHQRNLAGRFTFFGTGVALSRDGNFYVTQLYAAR